MMVTDLAGRTVDQTLRAGLDAAARGYPTGQHRAATAALRLIAANPEVQRTYDGRLKGLDDRARLDWLLSQLREDCLAEWYTLQEADRAYSGIGSVRGAIAGQLVRFTGGDHDAAAGQCAGPARPA